MLKTAFSSFRHDRFLTSATRWPSLTDRALLLDVLRVLHQLLLVSLVFLDGTDHWEPQLVFVRSSISSSSSHQLANVTVHGFQPQPTLQYDAAPSSAIPTFSTALLSCYDSANTMLAYSAMSSHFITSSNSPTTMATPPQRRNLQPNANPAIKEYGFDLNDQWHQDADFYDNQKVSGLTFPRVIKTSGFTSKLDIEGCDPLKLPVAALLYQQHNNH